MSLDVNATLGAMHIGVAAGAFLFGLTVAQAVYYYTHYQHDPWTFKVLVGWVVFLDLFHQICIEHNGYSYEIRNWDNPAVIAEVFWSLRAGVFLLGFITLTVQSFYVWRLWQLSKGYILPALVSILALTTFCVDMYWSKRVSRLTAVAQISRIQYLQTTVNSLSAGTDIVIALCMLGYLWNRRTGFEKTDSILGRLMVLCVNTGALTSITALWVIIASTVWPQTYIYIMFYYFLARFYSNSLLATLNMRNAIRRAGESSPSHELGYVSTGRMFQAAAHPASPSVAGGVVVQIERTIGRDGKEGVLGDDLDQESVNTTV
ncbi:hypothetical protein PENSPDRAFT_689073 [Peniophora sp. CONT]|nr:hypothetical protein PENSPDRAFT_689073 [Peniophora sp. CONT]